MDVSLSNDDLMQQMFWNDRDIASLETAHATQVKAGHAGIAARMGLHRERANSIKGDVLSSQEGKRLQLVTLIESSDIEIDKITDPLVATLEGKIISAQFSIDNATKSEPTAADMARIIEIRSICYAADDQLMTGSKLILLAMSGVDDFAVQAILSASAAFPLVDAATAVRARKCMAERLRPDAVGAVDANRTVLAGLLNAAAAAKRSFGSAAERAQMGMADDLERTARALGSKMSVSASQAPQA